MGTAIGVSLTNDGKMYVYPMNMIEFVECIVETTYKDEVIKSTSAVEIAASKAKSKPFASPDRKGRML
jgi:hypothetical protein